MIRTASQLRPDALFVSACHGDVALSLLDCIGEGVQGLVACIRAPSLRQGLARLVAQVANQTTMPNVAVVREWINASFDIAIEVVRLRDGRTRVAKIAELAGLEGDVIAMRDVFDFSVERIAAGGAIEGSFHPSGLMPRVAEQLQARGIVTDAALFRR